MSIYSSLVGQLMLILAVILMGVRLRGVGLGAMGALGILLLAYGFHLKPATPPFYVILVIMATVTAAGTLEAAGSLTLLTHQVDTLLRRYPNYLIPLSALAAYCATLLAGTSHITYALLPIIAAVAQDLGVRPERPLVATVIASQQALLASPISAPTATALTLLTPHGMTLGQMLLVLIPATLAGTLVGTWVAAQQGPSQMKPSSLASQPAVPPALSPAYRRQGKQVLQLFAIGIVCIVSMGLVPELRPGSGTLTPMPPLIALVMLSVVALALIRYPSLSGSIVKSRVFLAGAQAIIAILGVAWLGNTFFEAHMGTLTTLFQQYLQISPWKFGCCLFFTTLISSSQAATLQLLLPLGLLLNLPPTTLLGLLPAVNAFFFLPSYPTSQAAMELDKTGSTRVGKWVLNHSFMLPGLAALGTCLAISQLIRYLMLT